MRSSLLIGLAAGFASALLVASIASGSMLAVLLFYLAPLPIFLAGLGWGHWSALIAVLAAGGGLAVTFGLMFFPTFVVGIGGPAWWLSYLTLLGRAEQGGDVKEWYPVGRLVVWAAALGALVVVIAIPVLGDDEESVRATLRGSFERTLRLLTQTPADGAVQMPGIGDVGRMLDILTIMVLPTAAILSTVLQLFNLWLAGRIARISGRLARPWPDLPAMVFPAGVLIALAAILAATFLGGLPGLVANVAAAALLVAFAILGFAALHVVTRTLRARNLLLTGAYTAVAVLGWPILVMVLLGIAEAAFGLRGRAGHPPPAAV